MVKFYFAFQPKRVKKELNSIYNLITDSSASHLRALGCVVYELITFEKAFQGESLPQIKKSILENEPVIPSDVIAEINYVLEE